MKYYSIIIKSNSDLLKCCSYHTQHLGVDIQLFVSILLIFIIHYLNLKFTHLNSK